MLFDGGGLPAQLADDPREGNTRCGADQPLAMMEGDFGEPYRGPALVFTPSFETSV